MIAVLAQQAKGSYIGFGDQTGSRGGVLVVVGAFLGVIALMLIVQTIAKRRKGSAKNGSNGVKRPSKKRQRQQQKDALADYTSPVLDMNPLINPPTGRVLASDWKIHPVVEDDAEKEEEPVVFEEEGDLEDLPFDTDAVR
jgi:hypothetical protein